jgi:hypothetical protein
MIISDHYKPHHFQSGGQTNRNIHVLYFYIWFDELSPDINISGQRTGDYHDNEWLTLLYSGKF